MFKTIGSRADFEQSGRILEVFLASLDAIGNDRGSIWMNRKATGSLSRYLPEWARLTPTQFCKLREKSASFPTLSRLCHGLATNTEDCSIRDETVLNRAKSW
jgi:hypothetical protein